ncbi:MAG: nitrous oxide reductase accessory protein NosL [Flavobacteriales bacterium]|nr:nitrous oxide reductase accessory protein NosL [Flavobacteriales bacterium]
MKNLLPSPLTLLFFLSLALFSCGQTTPSIDFDHAECAHCRMNVVDRQFGAAIITLKGRQYVFDDVGCMIQHVGSGTIAESQVANWYVCDHARPGVLIDATTARYVNGPGFRSPMRGDAAAFATEAERTIALQEKGGEELDWKQLREVLKP